MNRNPNISNEDLIELLEEANEELDDALDCEDPLAATEAQRDINQVDDELGAR